MNVREGRNQAVSIVVAVEPRPVRTMWGIVTVRIPKLRRGAKDREWKRS